MRVRARWSVEEDVELSVSVGRVLEAVGGGVGGLQADPDHRPGRCTDVCAQLVSRPGTMV